MNNRTLGITNINTQNTKVSYSSSYLLSLTNTKSVIEKYSFKNKSSNNIEPIIKSSFNNNEVLNNNKHNNFISNIKKVTFKDPLVEYISIESYKIDNSILYHSKYNGLNVKRKRCKFKCAIF